MVAMKKAMNYPMLEFNLRVHCLFSFYCTCLSYVTNALTKSNQKIGECKVAPFDSQRE